MTQVSVENLAAKLRRETITMVTLGSAAILDMGPVTFCPYLSIGLAFHHLYAYLINISTEYSYQNFDSK